MAVIKLKIEKACGTNSGCENCTLREICIGSDLFASDNKQSLRCHCLVLAGNEGAHVYWTGEPLRSVYAVKSGCIKTYTVDEEGNERVRGFHLPGDILGLDAIGSGRYPSSACAVSEASVCTLPYSELTRALVSRPAFNGQFMALMGAHLSHALAMSGDYTAEQRLAAFLVLLHGRERARGMTQGEKLKLPMTRRDIASLLRLAPETISRLLNRFSIQGLLVSNSTELHLLDLPQLRQLAEPVGITTESAEVALRVA